MTQRIILIRHGETAWNNEFRFQGQTDTDLSPVGIKQAQALQKRFLAEKITALYCSDLSRARQTAEIINQPHGLEICENPSLRERSFGVWEGLTYQDIKAQYPELLEIWRTQPQLLHVPQGEDFSAVQERIVACLQKIYKTHPQGTIMVVSHGGPIAAYLCALLNKPQSELHSFRHQNTGVTIFQRQNGQIIIECLNDLSHLEI